MAQNKVDWSTGSAAGLNLEQTHNAVWSSMEKHVDVIKPEVRYAQCCLTLTTMIGRCTLFGVPGGARRTFVFELRTGPGSSLSRRVEASRRPSRCVADGTCAHCAPGLRYADVRAGYRTRCGSRGRTVRNDVQSDRSERYAPQSGPVTRVRKAAQRVQLNPTLTVTPSSLSEPTTKPTHTLSSLI